jgi:cysteinyl-tRNA synthetase
MELKLYLYNTLTRKNEPVFAADQKQLRFYCCGPTVYGPAHIGNFRTFVLQDLFRRVVEGLGLETRHVRNITDVDDKTIRGAIAAEQDLVEFTTGWRQAFETDCVGLNMLPPHESPSAVEHIPEQIAMIEELIQKDLAYVSDEGSVYYRISAFKDYGKLVGLNPEELRANADQRLSDADEYEKETVNDFVLWKTWKPADGPHKWDSPWGQGRPGWHLECSAMIRKYLGDSFDLHSGGVDLIFPHHENEIAQSEGCCGKGFARHWFHIAHLRIEGEKMSKSLGNLYTLEEIEEWGYTGQELRYVLLSGHYRQPLNFTKDSLGAAKSGMKRIAKVASAIGVNKVEKSAGCGRFSPVMEALCDDLNTAKALGALFTVIGELEQELKSGKSVDSFSADASALAQVLRVFGFEFSDEPKVAASAPAEVIALAEERQQARADKDWARSDELRDTIAAQGWVIKDSKQGFALEAKS